MPGVVSMMVALKVAWFMPRVPQDLNIERGDEPGLNGRGRLARLPASSGSRPMRAGHLRVLSWGCLLGEGVSCRVSFSCSSCRLP